MEWLIKVSPKYKPVPERGSVTSQNNRSAGRRHGFGYRGRNVRVLVAWQSKNRQTAIVVGMWYITVREAQDEFEKGNCCVFDAKTRGWSDFSVFVCVSRGVMKNVFG